MAEKFWFKKANLYSKKGFDTNELGTHPKVIEAFHKHCPNAKEILDYGCGDGSLILKLNKEVNVSLYDISEPMLQIARNNLKTFSPKVYFNSVDIPKNFFDCIFISMVFICAANKKEFEFIIEKVKEVKKKNGMVIVANPHPCFRDESFSSYFSEYTVGKEFDYFKNGDRHKLTIRDKSMSFYDYNWSLSYFLNSFIKMGLELIEFNEIKDVNINSYYNKNFSPSIIYTFK